jgi:autotransporter passenger strand-loop-strand repeat protein
MTTRSVTTGETSSGLTLSSGDFLYVSSGGTAISTMVSTGGTECVDSDGSAVSTTLTGADATQTVYAGGTAIGTGANRGGTENVSSGGSTSYTALSSGTQNVYRSATTDFAQVSRGGIGNIYAGGVSTDAVVSSGGTENVYASGTASATSLQSGATQFLYAGAAADVTALRGGGAEFVYSAATATFTTVDSGGILVLLPGGAVPDLQIHPGNERISTGIVLYRPQSTVDPLGASAVDIQVSSGAIEYLLPGGTTSFTTISSGGTENVFASATAVSTTVSSGGTEFVHSGADPISTTVNLGGSLDVLDLSYASGGSASVNASDLLTVSVGGHLYMQQLAGGYADEHFQLVRDAHSGTLLTTEAGAQCFRSFTRILTDRGEVAVEALRVGDLVRTVLGETMTPIIWIGCRHVDCARHPQPRKVWPVRVAAGAFGPGQPHTELFLSPDHAVYINEVLIPIKHLINGGSIAQVPVDHVAYYHIELPRHDVLLAEGLPSESFLDIRDGSNYANRPGPARLYPDFSARMWEAFGCARLIVTGPDLAAARALVALHAAEQAAA